MTNAVIVIDENTGQPLMVVVPDYDEQLKDPAYNPPGTKQIPVAIDTYKSLTPDELKSVIDSEVSKLGIVKPVKDDPVADSPADEALP